LYICNILVLLLTERKLIEEFLLQGRDPRAVDARGPISGQRVPVAGGMQGPPPHGMGQSAPPAVRPVRFPHSYSAFSQTF